jgi:hypothetical protein
MDFPNLISCVSFTYHIIGAPDSNNSTRNIVLANINYELRCDVSGMELLGRWKSKGFRGRSGYRELFF